MEKKGWIESEWGQSEHNRRARYYRLTKAGRKQLAAEKKGWNRMWVAIPGAEEVTEGLHQEPLLIADASKLRTSTGSPRTATSPAPMPTSSSRPSAGPSSSASSTAGRRSWRTLVVGNQ